MVEITYERVMDILKTSTGYGKIKEGGVLMKKLYLLAKGYTNRFPNGNNPYQITTRVLEECGEVASEVNHFEKSGIKSLKHGEPSKQHLADEIKQAINALVQLAVYYNVETELEESIDRSIAKMKDENLL